VAAVPPNDGEIRLLADIETLLQQKSTSQKPGLSSPVTNINAFIVSGLEHLESIVPAGKSRKHFVSLIPYSM
jgi:hypothetical protein